MAPQVPVIQVLSRQSFKEQHLVSLPNALPLAPLAPSSIRVQSTLLSLTTNNFTYARIGHLVGWWEFHPLPPSIPTEYSDPEEYGRISAWGYGTILESTSQIPVGTQIYGYLPIGTLPVDMAVKYDPSTSGRFEEVSPHRSKLMPIYNRYLFHPRAATADDRTSQGYDALMRILYETGFMLNRFVFAWQPSQLLDPNGWGDGWTFRHAQLRGATVLCFAASGKTGISFAHQLKYGRPDAERPAKVVAVGSVASKAFVEGTGLFDSFLEYTADEQDLVETLSLDADSKVVICEFGSRGAAAYRWHEKLTPLCKNLVALGIGSAPLPETPYEINVKMRDSTNALPFRMNAGGVRTAAFEFLGEDGYFDAVAEQWEGCKARGVVEGLKLVWGEGMEELGRGWERLGAGEVGPDEGLLFVLPVGV